MGTVLRSWGSRREGAGRARRAFASGFRALCSPVYRYCPPAAFAFGAACAFYSGVRCSGPMVGAAGLVAAVATILAASSNANARLRGVVALAGAFGAMYGTAAIHVVNARAAAGAALVEAFAGPGGASGTGRPPGVAATGVPLGDAVVRADGSASLRLSLRSIARDGPGSRERLEFGGNSAVVSVQFRGTSDAGGVSGGAGSPLDGGVALLEVAGSLRRGRDGPVIYAVPGGTRILRRSGLPSRIRNAVRGSFRAALARVGSRSSGLVVALLLGARDGLDGSGADLFRQAGCAHILALSGQHLSILASLATAILVPLAGTRIARVGTVLFALCFVLVAGPGPSLVRAVLMLLLGLLARILDRPQETLSILSGAFVLALAGDPESAGSLSFILSYLALAGISTLSERFDYTLGRRLPPCVSRPLAAGFAAQAATAPVTLAAFGVFVPAGVLASAVSGPLVLALMWWAIAWALPCSLFSALSGPVAFCTDILYDLLIGTMRLAGTLPAVAAADGPSRLWAAIVVVSIALVVYARPDVDARVRFPRFPAPVPGGRRPRDDQTPGPEFPHRSPAAGADPR